MYIYIYIPFLVKKRINFTTAHIFSFFPEKKPEKTNNHMEDHAFRGGFASVPRFGAPSGGVEGSLRRVLGPGGRAGARGGLGGAMRGARRALRVPGKRNAQEIGSPSGRGSQLWRLDEKIRSFQLRARRFFPWLIWFENRLGESWFAWWFNHIPGPSIFPKRTPMWVSLFFLQGILA